VRRDRLGILRDMLKASKNGAKKTQIMYKASLSFGQLQEYLSLLEESGLIENEKGIDGNVRYKTSEKGYKFLKGYRRIEILITKNGPGRKD